MKPELLDGKALVLAPGQRADLLVSVEQGEIRLALDLFEDVVEIGYLTPGGESGEIAPVAENFALPPNPLPALGALNEAATIGIVLEGGIKGGLKSAILNGAERDLRTLLENGKGWAMNGVAGPAPEPLFTAKQGETVCWRSTTARVSPSPSICMDMSGRSSTRRRPACGRTPLSFRRGRR